MLRMWRIIGGALRLYDGRVMLFMEDNESEMVDACGRTAHTSTIFYTESVSSFFPFALSILIRCLHR